MKKLLISIAAIMAMTVSAAFAAQLEASENDGKLIIGQSDDMSDMLVAAYYDEDGALMSAQQVGASEGSFVLDPPEGYAFAKAFDIGKEVYDIAAAETAPAASEAPVATEAPAEETAVPSATRKPLDPSYPEEKDQVLAPAVVKKVINSSGDGVDQYTVTALLRGQEVNIPVDIDVYIKNVPSAFGGVRGEDASALKKGDVVYFLTNIKGDKVRSIDLLYRPSDIFASSFSGLYTGGSTGQKASYGSRLPSDNAYVLGIITNASNSTLTLYPVTGEGGKSFEIPYTKDTVTYIYKLNSKNDPYIARSSDIPRSSIPKRAYDDNDDISSLSDYDCNIAFVRTVGREAVDIVVYEAAEE